MELLTGQGTRGGSRAGVGPLGAGPSTRPSVQDCSSFLNSPGVAETIKDCCRDGLNPKLCGRKKEGVLAQGAAEALAYLGWGACPADLHGPEWPGPCLLCVTAKRSSG